MEELRVTKDERWTAMVEGRWDEFGADLPDDVPGPRRRSRRRRSSSASPGSASPRCATAASINVAIGSVLGIEQPLWFEPGYTSLSRMLASRSGIRSVASLNELAHLTAIRRDGTSARPSAG